MDAQIKSKQVQSDLIAHELEGSKPCTKTPHTFDAAHVAAARGGAARRERGQLVSTIAEHVANQRIELQLVKLIRIFEPRS